MKKNSNFDEKFLMAISEKHTNPVLATRLRPLLAARQWQAIPLYLDTLSNAQFRTAGYMLGEQLSANLPSADFWGLFSVLVDYNAKAFLVTLLRQVSRRIRQGTLLWLDDDACRALAALRGRDLDVQKTLLELLPLATSPAHVVQLFDVLGLTDIERRIPFLVRQSTLPALYVLFLSLKYVEYDHALLVRTVYLLMKRGDSISFNLASLLKSYFGLEEVRGQFSLQIQPFQLARLESSYEAFVGAMNF